MKNPEINEQRVLNERAIAIGAKIKRAVGYTVELNDEHYIVSTRSELYSLISNLEKQHVK